MSDRIVDIKFLVPVVIEVTSDGENFEEETYETGDEEYDITIIDEDVDEVVTLKYSDGFIGTVSRSAFEITKEY